MFASIFISLTICVIILASIISFLLLCCGKKEKEPAPAKAEKLIEGGLEIKEPSIHISFKDATGVGAATSSLARKSVKKLPAIGSGPPTGNVGGLKGGPGATCPMMPVDEQDPEVLAYLKGQYPTANKLVSAPLPPGQTKIIIFGPFFELFRLILAIEDFHAEKL
uniref:Uncharacterized protein n=1 Tax=Romanomermis culicivorax TaxID=13658 RepID=A0A915K626_ROMCU